MPCCPRYSQRTPVEFRNFRHSSFFFTATWRLGQIFTSLPYCSVMLRSLPRLSLGIAVSLDTFFLFLHRHLTIWTDFYESSFLLLFVEITSQSSFWDASWPNTIRLGSVRSKVTWRFHGLSIASCKLTSRRPRLKAYLENQGANTLKLRDQNVDWYIYTSWI